MSLSVVKQTRVASPWDCECTSTKPTRRVQSNGVVIVALQCQECGNARNVKKSDYDVDSLPAYDDSLREQRSQRINEQLRRENELARNAERDQWFAKYDAYLRSGAWRERRNAVLARDRYLCRAGLPVCTIEAQQVHHITYAHAFNEPLFDLISVCCACHDEITRMDREKRS